MADPLLCIDHVVAGESADLYLPGLFVDGKEGSAVIATGLGVPANLPDVTERIVVDQRRCVRQTEFLRLDGARVNRDASLGLTKVVVIVARATQGTVGSSWLQQRRATAQVEVAPRNAQRVVPPFGVLEDEVPLTHETLFRGLLEVDPHTLVLHDDVVEYRHVLRRKRTLDPYAISTVTGVEAHNYQTVRQDFRLEPVCPVLVDDMESGTEKWSHGADAGTDLWTLSTPESHSPSHAWHNPGSGEVTDNSLWNSAPIVLGPDAYLSFWHHYEFESSRYHYDGAVIETSTDGGGTWVDLGPYITAGGYNGTISTCCGNPLGGRSAWVDETDTWTQVQADLSSFAGQSVYIRWRIGSDASVALTGWYVDDILVTTSGPACEPPYSVYLPLVSNER